MTIAKIVWLSCGLSLAAFSIQVNSINAAEIPPAFVKKDYESCMEQVVDGQDEYYKQSCQCFVDKMQIGMDFEEYIIFASGIDLENMSKEEIVIKAMSNKKISVWIQECATMAAPLLK